MQFLCFNMERVDSMHRRGPYSGLYDNYISEMSQPAVDNEQLTHSIFSHLPVLSSDILFCISKAGPFCFD
jgi:hypothetical protein